MQRDKRRTVQKTRRSFLGSLGLATVGLGVVSQSSAAQPDESPTFVVEQGDQCVPLEPLSGDVPIEEQYGWDLEYYSATGLVDLQRADTSILFLYDGPNGLSLVIVHDSFEVDSNGGSATFEFAGLPLDGEWVVADDLYDGSSNYDQWTRDGYHATVDWTWDDDRTDGGVFSGLSTETDLELSIDPSFNAEAELYGEFYDGIITDWEVLSESDDGLTRTSLALDEPIVLRHGTCPTAANDFFDRFDGDEGNDGDGGDEGNDGDGGDGGNDGNDGDGGNDGAENDFFDRFDGDEGNDGDGGDDGNGGDGGDGGNDGAENDFFDRFDGDGGNAGDEGDDGNDGDGGDGGNDGAENDFFDRFNTNR